MWCCPPKAKNEVMQLYRGSVEPVCCAQSQPLWFTLVYSISVQMLATVALCWRSEIVTLCHFNLALCLQRRLQDIKIVIECTCKIVLFFYLELLLSLPAWGNAENDWNLQCWNFIVLFASYRKRKSGRSLCPYWRRSSKEKDCLFQSVSKLQSWQLYRLYLQWICFWKQPKSISVCCVTASRAASDSCAIPTHRVTWVCLCVCVM